MTQGGKWRHAAGFTIVEVMIVLAVSSALFVSAVVLVNGRQAKTEFTTSVNSLQQQLQQVINETTSGYYPNNGNFTCTGHPGSVVTFTTSSTAQGSNAGCIFLGKAVQFGLAAPDGNSGNLGVLPIVGNQNVPGGQPVLKVSDAVPRAAYPASPADQAPTDAVSTVHMAYGLAVADDNKQCNGGGLGGVCYKDASGTFHATGVMAVVAGASDGTIATPGVSTGLASGSQQFSLYAVGGGAGGSTPNDTFAHAAAAMGNIGTPGTSNLSAVSQVLVCVTDGSRSGLFTISGNGSLSVNLTIESDATC